MSLTQTDIGCPACEKEFEYDYFKQPREMPCPFCGVVLVFEYDDIDVQDGWGVTYAHMKGEKSQ